MTSISQSFKATVESKFSLFFFPALFVLLWSTGFIGAKYGLPYVEPFTFLSLRFAITCAILFMIIAIMRPPWPKSSRAVFHISVSGLLLHGLYLGGIFSAINLGMSAGIAALIVGIQPILSCLFAKKMLDETMSRFQWFGLILGFLGVGLVVAEKIFAFKFGQDNATVIAFVAIAVSLIGISYGIIYQKKYCAGMHPITGTSIQYASTFVLLFVIALTTENMTIQWTGEFIFALFWLVGVLSIGSIFILMYLIQHRSMSSVTSLFYMVPPVTAVEEYLIYNQSLTSVALVGILVVAIGVIIASKK
ncbi:DMT family transporter [Sessilibacter corallicola]